jgi:hypothetical protein
MTDEQKQRIAKMIDAAEQLEAKALHCMKSGLSGSHFFLDAARNERRVASEIERLGKAVSQ